MPQENPRLDPILQRLRELPDLERGRRHRDDFGLQGIGQLLDSLGRPQEDLPAVHIAGSKGKGTTALYLAALLYLAGTRTGAYLSPHLHRLEERFLLDCRPAPAEQLAMVLEQAAAAAGESPHCTLFDLFTASAILLFRAARCGAAVLECGLGGRLDSTNIIHPRVSVITSVEREHEEVLGRGIDRVALEKAGIIKAGAPLVTGCRGRALQVLRRGAAAAGVPCAVRGEDFGFTDIQKGQDGFTVKNMRGGGRIETGIKARPLLHSLTLAGAAFARFAGREATPVELALVSRLQLPGRFEYLPGKPALLLDVAHTPRSLTALARAVRTWYGDRRLILLFATGRDKGWHRPLALLSALAAQTWLVTLPCDRAVAPEELAKVAGRRTRLTRSPEEALDEIAGRCGERDLVLVTGSHSLVGPARLVAHSRKDRPNE